MLENRKKRMTDSIGYFNFVRGFGIIFVVLAHSVSLFVALEIHEGLFSNVVTNIGSSIMAMFFMVSGFGFRSRKIKKTVQEQARLFLIPYVVTVGLILSAKLALAILKQRSFMQYGGDLVMSYLLALNRGFKGTILGMPVNNVAMLWFLWALFGGWVIYNAITRINNSKVQYLLVVCCVLLSFVLIRCSKVWPFVLPHMLQATGFICVGKMIRDSDLLDKKVNTLLWIGLSVPALITLVFGGVDIYTCNWKLPVIDYVGVLCMGILFLKLFSWIQNMEYKGKVYTAVSVIGLNTLEILCIHAFDEKVIPWHKWTHFFTGRIWLGVLIYAIVRVCFIFIAFKIVKFVQHKFFKKKKTKHKKISLQIDK